MKRLGGSLVVLLALAACQREAPAPAAVPDAGDMPGQAATPVVPELKDVVETDPRYIVGITYPPEVNKYPGLAIELQQYVDAARGELMEAVEGMPTDSAAGPYDLSLVFTTVSDTPQVFAVAADGSSYTGGAHGTPLVARFVWLPERHARLRIEALVTQPAAWREVSAYVRERLHADLSQRVDADDLEPGERQRIIRSAGRMIDAGSSAEAENFEQFEPVLDANGKLLALRFVFPPYQVGPYSDGVQSVEVPAAILLPHVAPEYRALFVGS